MEPNTYSILDSINNVVNGKAPIPISEITVYGKKQYEQALDKLIELQEKYATDMHKFKKDSAQYAQAKKAYADSSFLYNNVMGKAKDIAVSLSSSLSDAYEREISQAYDPKTKKWARRPATYDHKGELVMPESSYFQYYHEEGLGLPKDKLEKLTPRQIREIDYKDNLQYYERALTKGGDYADYLPADKFNEVASWYVDALKKNLEMAEKEGNANVWAAGGGMGAAPREHVKKEIEILTSIVDLVNKSKIKPVSTLVNAELAPIPLYKKPTEITADPPQRPAPPADVKYDSAYENLNMKPLWATELKSNPDAIIGTLHPLDPLYNKRGFTLEEAMKFPKEIRDKYNIDYIASQMKKRKSLNNAKIKSRK